jgi:hypothetical protein
MGDHHKGHVVAMNDFHQQFEHSRPFRLTEVSRWLVGKHKAGTIDQGARDGHALTLATRQLRRPLIGARRQPDGS